MQEGSNISILLVCLLFNKIAINQQADTSIADLEISQPYKRQCIRQRWLANECNQQSVASQGKQCDIESADTLGVDPSSLQVVVNVEAIAPWLLLSM